MVLLPFIICSMLSGSLVSAVPVSNDANSSNYVDWTTFKASGVNLGGWLVQEANIDPEFWVEAGNATDEWDLCAQLGSRCGDVFENRYETFITPGDIDNLAAAGVNVLRIPTTYAAWVTVPGSQLYSGRQVNHLEAISTYAIDNYGMHIILDVHSLPGGVNGVTIGEKQGNFNWFHNETALDYSYQAIDAVIDYIQNSGSPQSYTLAPINEPVDNRNESTFGSPESLSDDGAAWVLGYIQGVVERTKVVNPNIPIMFQGGFKDTSYWSGHFPKGTNLVFDIHSYYFAGRPTTSANLPDFICFDAQTYAEDGKFPAFIGEWSIQAAENNTFASRAQNLNTGLRAWSEFAQGSAYWTAKFYGSESVDGEGVQGDYWAYGDLVEMGSVDPSSGAACS